MQQLLIEVSHLDQIFVEEECSNIGETLSSFFKKLLDGYRDGLTAKEDLGLSKALDVDECPTEAVKPKIGRRSKLS